LHTGIDKAGKRVRILSGKSQLFVNTWRPKIGKSQVLPPHEDGIRSAQPKESSMKTGRFRFFGRKASVTLAIGVGLAAALVNLGAATSLSAQSPKAAKSNCIAIASPTVQGAPGNAAETANGVRELIASYLSGPSSKVVALDAKLPSQAREEANQKGCEPLLFVTVTRKTASGHGILKALGHGAAASSWRLPGGSTAASTTASVGAAVGLQAASSMAASTKSKDEVRLEYRLESANGQIQFGPTTETQTAKTDGEDLLTPVVARAAEAIVTRKRAR
jgi:hypothetical protein